MGSYEKEDKGSISEWNEGDLKNLRLHKAQIDINIGKVNPFSFSEDFNSWNYMVWKGGIDVLFGEGMSKYGEEEIEEVNSVKSLIETFLGLKIIFQKVYFNQGGIKREKFIPNKDNQLKLKEYMELYEKIVKKYNDNHGLSTRNRDLEDTRGL